MANLLVLSEFPDRNFVSVSSIFTYLHVNAVRKYFDKVYVVSPVAWFPRVLGLAGRFSYRVAERLAKSEYSYDNVSVFFPRYLTRGGSMTGRQIIRKRYPACKRSIRKHNLRFDLIHAHMSGIGPIGIRLARDHGVPSVLTMHSNHDWLINEIHERDPEIIRGWRESDALIRVTPFDIDDLGEAAGRKDHIVYIPNGFDDSKVPSSGKEELRRKLGIPLNRRVLVSVARWIPRKDPLILMDAMARLVSRGRSQRPLLIMIGENRMPQAIAERIASHGLQGDVQLLGVKAPERVMEYITAGDISVLYSHSEGNPTVMFESLGCGRPYIGSDVGGVRAVLTDTKIGRYGPARDVDALTSLLEQSLDTEWDEQYIRQQARQYTWEAIAQQTYEQVYRPLLTSRVGER